MASWCRGLGLRALVIVGVVSIASVGQASGADKHPYLALGDSVVFGFITQAGFEYFEPSNFVGYPDYVAAALRLTEVNASCPGEATTGFISPSGADNGCDGFKATVPLHVTYATTQFDFATDFLLAHPDTKLVTLGIGANDVFILQKQCANDPDPQACLSSRLPDTLTTIATNIGTILFALRATGFNGVLMIVNYYSLDYSDPVGTAGTQLLNQALTAFADANGAVVADVFSAFQAAATTPIAGGKTCNAGLLNASPQNQFLCDVHPSQSGQKLIAATVEDRYKAAIGAEGEAGE